MFILFLVVIVNLMIAVVCLTATIYKKLTKKRKEKDEKKMNQVKDINESLAEIND